MALHGATVLGAALIQCATAAEMRTLLGAAAAASGVPAGGTAGQYLRKSSSTDYDMAWATTLPAAQVAAGTFATGNFVFPANLTVTTRAGIGHTAAISTDVNLDVVSQFGVRPSTSVAYPTVLAQGFAGRFYAIHDAGDWGFVIGRAANDAFGANLTFYKTRSTTGARTAVQNGDLLGRISFQGVSQTGGTVNNAAEIRAYVNGTVSNGVLPVDLHFNTTTSGDLAATPTPRWILTSTGHWVPGTNNVHTIGTASFRPSTVFGVLANFSGLATLTAGFSAGASSSVTGTMTATTFSGNLAYTFLTFSGLTTGQVWRATGATTAAFGALDLANASAVTGILPNANTTATALNTASAIVARDGSGNFAAGTITAALTGNASTATALQNVRTLWGQNFDGTGNVSGSLSSVGDITGTGAVTLTATAGTLALVATGANAITATTNGTLRASWDSAGTFAQVGNATIGGTLGVTGNSGFGVAATTARLEIRGATADSSLNALVIRDSLAVALFSVRNDGRIDASGAVNLASTLTVTGTLRSDGTNTQVSQTTTAAANLTLGSGTQTGFGAFFQIRAPAGQNRMIQWQSASSNRWIANVDTTAESGSNAGSNWELVAYTDGGVLIDRPITIARVAGGTFAISRPVTMASTLAVTGVTTLSSTLTQNGATANLVQDTAGSVTMNVGAGTQPGFALLNLRSPAGQNAVYRVSTNNTLRWQWGKNTSTESGSDAGSGWFLAAYNDAGTLIDQPIGILRAADTAVTIARPLAVATATAGTNSLLTVGASARAISTYVTVNAAAGQLRGYQIQSAGSIRWLIYGNNNAESGSNAGSDFRISAYTDGGVNIDNPLIITRAAGGTIAFSSARPITGGTYNGQTISATAAFTGTLSVASHFIGGGDLRLNGTLGANGVVWQDAGVTRAIGRLNTGVNWVLNARDTSGVSIDNVITIALDAGGAIAFASARPITGGTYNGQTISSAASFTGTVAVAGTLTANNGVTVTGSVVGVTRTSAANGALTAKVTADAQDRFILTAGGVLFWGDGTSAQDVRLERSAANTLLLNDAFVINYVTGPQLAVRYDSSNRFDVSVSSAGAVTFDAVGASAGFTFSDLLRVSASLSTAAMLDGQLEVTRSAALAILAGQVVADLAYRFVAYADGLLEWGSGSGARDVNLYRAAPNLLKTDDAFEAAGGYVGLGTMALVDDAPSDGSLYGRKDNDWEIITGESGLVTPDELLAMAEMLW